jgi:hypothetical protein
MNNLNTVGYYIYNQFNIHKFYVLPTECINVFYTDLRTNSDYFTITDEFVYLRRSVFTVWYELHFHML